MSNIKERAVTVFTVISIKGLLFYLLVPLMRLTSFKRRFTFSTKHNKQISENLNDTLFNYFAEKISGVVPPQPSLNS